VKAAGEKGVARKAQPWAMNPAMRNGSSSGRAAARD
jgi:hypothetical protein